MLLALAAVHATLLRPLPAYAPAGKRLVVAFALRDAHGRPVDEKRVFVKVICPEKDVSTVAYATDLGHGHYRVVATMPAGGLGHIRVGHDGTYYPVR